jgi:hypothetical protein
MKLGARIMTAAAGAIAATGAGTLSPSQSLAQSRGASMEIRLTARVPVFCGIREEHRGPRISGHDNEGRRVNIPGREGNYRVRCNTPYALGLERNYRTAEHEGSEGGERRVDAGPAGLASGIVTASLPNPSGLPRLASADGGSEMIAQDYGVTLRVSGIGEIFESWCVLAAAGHGASRCDAFAGANDTRRGAPLGRVSLFVTGTPRDPAGATPARWEGTEAGPLVEIPLMEPMRLPVMTTASARGVSMIKTGSIGGGRAGGRQLAMRDAGAPMLAPQPERETEAAPEQSGSGTGEQRQVRQVRQLDHVTLSLTGKF